jgi:hypothetical protein
MSPVILDKEIGIIRRGEMIERDIKTRVPLLPEGRYSFGLSLNTILGSAINDSFSPIKLVKNDR